MKEWYLMTSQTRPNELGGYENEHFRDFKEDAFLETLETDVADTVTIYNYDLTESFQTRCIVQGNVADTQLKSMERTVLFPIGTVKAGQYMFFDNRYWLINGYPGNNKIYEKVTAPLCQYKIKWQNAKGEIIERWISFSSASKYDVGEKSSNKVMFLASDDFMVQIPNDEESLNIDGKRVFIDTNIENPTKVFKITRNDDALYDYGEHGGVLHLIADRDELNTESDNKELMICDYFTPDNHEPVDRNDILLQISGRPNLQLGSKRTYTITCTDENGNAVATPTDFAWNVVCDFDDVLETEISGDTITLRIDDDDYYADEKFKLQALIGDVVKDELIITVTGIWG